MNYNKNPLDYAIEENLEKNRQLVIAESNKTLKEQEEIIDCLCLGRTLAENDNNLKIIWNIASFIGIISFDFRIVGKDLFTAKNEWVKRYYARQSYLIIYETIDDLFELLGKEFKQILCLELKSYPNLNLELKQFKKLLNEFKSKHFKKLKNIRNTAIAHRDKDSLKQIDLITEISYSEAIEITTDYSKIINNISNIIQKLIQVAPKELTK